MIKSRLEVNIIALSAPGLSSSYIIFSLVDFLEVGLVVVVIELRVSASFSSFLPFLLNLRASRRRARWGRRCPRRGWWGSPCKTKSCGGASCRRWCLDGRRKQEVRNSNCAVCSTKSYYFRKYTYITMYIAWAPYWIDLWICDKKGMGVWRSKSLTARQIQRVLCGLGRFL